VRQLDGGWLLSGTPPASEDSFAGERFTDHPRDRRWASGPASGVARVFGQVALELRPPVRLDTVGGSAGRRWRDTWLRAAVVAVRTLTGLPAIGGTSTPTPQRERNERDEAHAEQCDEEGSHALELPANTPSYRQVVARRTAAQTAPPDVFAQRRATSSNVGPERT
jgi:hypothetical protein